MEAETISLREGDVYRWRYREPDPDRDGTWGRYHCCSCIAVVSNGRLRDTYWSFGHDGRTFEPDDLPKLELTYLGNFADLEKKPKYERDYYDAADIVDLTHSNGGYFFLRKGAKRSAAKMLETAKYNLERAESDERMAIQRASRLRTAIASIEAGDTTGHLG